MTQKAACNMRSIGEMLTEKCIEAFLEVPSANGILFPRHHQQASTAHLLPETSESLTCNDVMAAGVF